MKQLPIEKIFGVGKVTAKNLHDMQIKTCEDLQKISLIHLHENFGNRGKRFYDLCRGIDSHPVETTRNRKSLSVEETFPKDTHNYQEAKKQVIILMRKLKKRLSRISHSHITKQFVKIKFADFKQTTVERLSNEINEKLFVSLFEKGWLRQSKPIRLIGVGVKFGEDGIKARSSIKVCCR